MTEETDRLRFCTLKCSRCGSDHMFLWGGLIGELWLQCKECELRHLCPALTTIYESAFDRGKQAKMDEIREVIGA